MPWSMAPPSAARKLARCAWRAAGATPARRCAMSARLLPETRTTPMPPRPGAVATAAMVSALLLLEATGLDHPVDLPLLGDRQHVIDRPVQHQAGREREEHAGEHDRHDPHDLRLDRVRRRRIEPGLDQ